MASTIPQSSELVKNLFELLAAHRPMFGQERVYRRVVALVLGEVLVFARHTVTQVLMSLGLTEGEWSAWYRLFSAGRFKEEAAAAIMVAQTLSHVPVAGLYVVAGDGTQTPRTSRKIEGVGWLRNMRTPPFKVGIHLAQRWFNGSWMMPPEQGYSRAMPLRWLPAFTPKATRHISAACTEWQAAVQFLIWLRATLTHLGRPQQPVLMLADGSYDTLNLWKNLPAGVILLARSAKNRVLYHLPGLAQHGNRKYGPRALTPQGYWGQRAGWRKLTLLIRGKKRPLQYRVEGPFLRQGAAHCPLLLIVVRGQKYRQYGHTKHRLPLPFLVNAQLDPHGHWTLPLAIETLLFWAWQRWEIEVCHRELKSTFGLGDKQCWQPHAAIASVQWTAWVYAILLLAGYRTWGLCAAPPVPTRWWRGSGRWSFNTLWRAYRANLWGSHTFQPLRALFTGDWPANEAALDALRHAAFAATPL